MLVKVQVLRSIIFLSSGVTEGRLRFTQSSVWPCRSSVTSKCLHEITQLLLLWLQALRIQLSVNPETICYPIGDRESLIHVYACIHRRWFSQAFSPAVQKMYTRPWPHHLYCQTVTRQQVTKSAFISYQAQSVVKYGHLVSDIIQQTLRSLDLSWWLTAVLSVCRATKSNPGFWVLGQTLPRIYFYLSLNIFLMEQ